MDNKFDGDTASCNIVYSDEAVAEVKKFLNSKAYYTSSSGGVSFSSATDTVKYVLHNMTG